MLDAEGSQLLLAHIDDIRLHFVDNHNSFGLLEGGTLTITAPTAQIPTQDSIHTEDDGANITITLCNTSHELDYDFISVSFDESPLRQEREHAVYVLILTYPRRPHGRLPKVHWLRSLILAPADRFEQPSAWARIGSFNLRYNYLKTQSSFENCTTSTFVII